MPLEIGQIPPDLPLTGLQDRDDPFIDVFEKTPAGVENLLADLSLKLGLQGVEGGVDLGFGASVLNDLQNALLDVDAALDHAENLVAGAKDTLEQPELLAQQLVDALLRPILEVEEIDHRHVDLLPVAVAAADALLDPLRVPG